MTGKLLLLTIVLSILAFAGFVFLQRALSNAVTVVTVETVAPGVQCAKMVTADGAAISCWKVDQ